MNGIEKELEDMTKALEEPSAGAEKLRSDPPPTDPPKTEAPGTRAPGTDPPDTEAPRTTAPGTTAPPTEAPTTELPAEDERDKTIRDLREKLAKKDAEPTEAPPTKAPSTDAPISEEDFLGDADLDELTRDPSLFNKILNKVHKKGVEVGRAESRTSSESIVRSVPDLVKNNVALVAKLKEVNEKFYADNEDLVPFKKVVGVVFEELIAKDPNKTYDELLPEVSEEARSRLELYKDVNRKKKDDPPKLPHKGKGGKRKTTKPDATPLQDEMDEMDSALGLE